MHHYFLLYIVIVSACKKSCTLFLFLMLAWLLSHHQINVVRKREKQERQQGEKEKTQIFYMWFILLIELRLQIIIANTCLPFLVTYLVLGCKHACIGYKYLWTSPNIEYFSFFFLDSYEWSPWHLMTHMMILCARTHMMIKPQSLYYYIITTIITLYHHYHYITIPSLHSRGGRVIITLILPLIT